MQRPPQKLTDLKTFTINHKVKILKLVKFLIIVAIFSLIFTKFPYEKFSEVVANINFNLATVGILLSFVSTFIYTFFLWIVIHEKNIPISLRKLFKINLGIKFYSLFSPTSLAGSGIRLYRIAENHRLEDALSAITFSRFMDMFVTMLDGMIWIIVSLYLDEINIWWIIGIIASLIVLWISFLLLSKPAIRLLDWVTVSFKGPSLVMRGIVFLKKYIYSLSLFKQLKLNKVILLILISLTYDLVNTSIHFIMARSIGIQINFVTLGWMRSVIAISSLIPINTIGGVGIKEMSSYFLMTANGVSPEMAVTFSLMNYLRTSFVSFTGGIIELVDTLKGKGKKQL